MYTRRTLTTIATIAILILILILVSAGSYYSMCTYITYTRIHVYTFCLPVANLEE